MSRKVYKVRGLMRSIRHTSSPSSQFDSLRPLHFRASTSTFSSSVAMSVSNASKAFFSIITTSIFSDFEFVAKVKGEHPDPFRPSISDRLWRSRRTPAETAGNKIYRESRVGETTTFRLILNFAA